VKIGDRVIVVQHVWDDHRNKDWFGWSGVVKSVKDEKRPNNPYPIYVFFPMARGKWRSYDFTVDELRPE
jgi:hypothetical protein